MRKRKKKNMLRTGMINSIITSENLRKYSSNIPVVAVTVKSFARDWVRDEA